MFVKPLFVHVPKTGGNMIRHLFGDFLAGHGHRTAASYWEKPSFHTRGRKSFAFIRNPWDRAVSMYFWSGYEKGFLGWCREWAPDQIGATNRAARSLLCDSEGALLVDTVYRFEVFDAAVDDIANGLEAPIPVCRPHKNENPRKPGGLDYRTLYCEESHAIVTDLCSWDISEFNYTFE